VIVYLVRHASAEARETWGGDDRLRPLDNRGLRQAEGLVEQLGRREFRRIVSSPYVRCVETVVPLAHARGLAVEHSEALGEGADAGAALALFRSARIPLVACVHGDLAEELLGEAARARSTAVVELQDDEVAVRERLTPAS
jgi:phosphohistidine phosphatase SixA